MSFQSLYPAEDQVYNGVVAQYGIHHQVIQISLGPSLSVIFRDECGALAVDGLNESLRLLLALPLSNEATHLFFKRRIDKRAECLGSSTQEPTRAAPHDYAVP